jgi:hypothetical protein
MRINVDRIWIIPGDTRNRPATSLTKYSQGFFMILKNLFSIN